MVRFSVFFRYINCKEKFLLIIGTICAINAGALMPGISVAMGEVTNTFDPTNGYDAIYKEMKRIGLIITLVGVGLWVFGYIYFSFW